MTARFFVPWFALAAALAQAQQAPMPSAAPQSVSVTADEPLPLNAPDALDRSVRQLPAGDAETQPLFDAPEDLLRLDPSITLEERGPGGVQADLSIRGATFEQTLVLVDGLRLNDPETGHLNLDLALPLEAVSRIDVLHGSGSTFFGSDAIGGAVNLLTARPTRDSASLTLGGGNMGQTEQHLQLSYAGDRVATRLTGARDTSDGFFYAGQNDRGFHSNVLSLDSFLTPTKTLEPTEVILGASDRPFGANLFYGDYDSAERTKGWLAAIRQPLPDNFQADFAFRKHTDEYILLVQDPAVYENNHVDTLWQTDLRGNRTAGQHLELAYGLESDGDGIRSNSLGRHARNQGAGYANLSLHALGRLTLSAGAREEVYAGPNAVFTPTASAGFFLGHGLRAHAAAGRGFRLPTYVDLYYSDPATIGNPNLKPETSASYEGGLDWVPHLGTVGTQPRLELGTTGFTLRQTNAIDYSKYVLTAPWQANNVGRIAYSGVEATATLHLTPRQQIDLGETFVHAPPAPAGLISEYAYNYASHNASFAYQGLFPGIQLAARTQVSVVQQVTRTAYPLWNVALTRTRGFVRPYVRVDDVANVRYQELVGVPLPGRSILAGITLAWPGR
jgi:iron complex outermembrane receptor protein